jgi:hypothetical protein
MTDIYIDPSVTSMPDAADHLSHLVDTGHRLILVGASPPAVRSGLPAADTAETMPDRVAAGSWRVSADPEMCGDRLPGLQTLLVGPRLAPTPRPGPRCDAEARDLSSAILEILGRDVMG